MDLEQSVIDGLTRHEQEEKDDIAVKYARIRNYFRLCESPIEQIFLFQILNYAPYRLHESQAGRDVASNRPVIVCKPWDMEDFGDFNVKITVQHEIQNLDGTKYRTDFLFEVFRDATVKLQDDDGFTRLERMSEIFARLVVEVDGHNFHEKTKEQAKRDKSRDRQLTNKDFTVFHFTGSEVFNNPSHVADEVEQFIAKIMVKVNSGELPPINFVESGMWIDIDFEMPRYLKKDYGRKRIQEL